MTNQLDTTDQIFSTLVVRSPNRRAQIVMTVEQTIRTHDNHFVVEGTNLATGRYTAFMDVRPQDLEQGTFQL